MAPSDQLNDSAEVSRSQTLYVAYFLCNDQAVLATSEKQYSLKIIVEKSGPTTLDININSKTTEKIEQEMDVGFKASTEAGYKIVGGAKDVIKFKDVLKNQNGHFNPLTGVFTAPREGYYSCGLKHDERVDILAKFEVIHEQLNLGPGGGSTRTVVSYAYTGSHLVEGAKSYCSNSNVPMNQWDRLFVEVTEAFDGDFFLTYPSTFSVENQANSH